MMGDLIQQILEKHGIKDEKLASALAEIFDLYYEESQSKMASDINMKLLMQGIKK